MTQVSKINGIPIVNTVVSGFTYDGVNTLTISETDGTVHNAIITNIGGGSGSSSLFNLSAPTGAPFAYLGLGVIFLAVGSYFKVK